MTWILTDAEFEEEVRCAALGIDGPNGDIYRAEALAVMSDHARKSARENGEARSLFAPEPSRTRCAEQKLIGDTTYRCIDKKGHAGGCHLQAVKP